MKKCILLTGGCGYIGSHTAYEIIQEYPDYHIVIVDNLSNSDSIVINKLKLFTKNLFYYNLDIKNNIKILKDIGMKRELKYEFVDRRAGDSPQVYANCDKALHLLGWKAELTLEDMIKDSLFLLSS